VLKGTFSRNSTPVQTIFGTIVGCTDLSNRLVFRYKLCRLPWNPLAPYICSRVQTIISATGTSVKSVHRR